jgi:hypothetical protein
MGQEKPTFKGGNISIASALNRLANALWRHGVNPAGRPGWSESADGWVPPVVFEGGGESSVFPWGIVPVGDQVYSIATGTILIDSSTISDVLPCSNPSFEFSPSEGAFIAIKITLLNPTSYELVKLNSWPEEDGYTVTYTGTPGVDFVFTAKHYPLWAFIDTKPDESWSGFGEDLFGKRICPPTDLKLVDALYKTPTGHYIVAPDFDVAHMAFSV